jgi:hypothetical protein
MNRMKKGGGENFFEEVFFPAPPFSRTFGGKGWDCVGDGQFYPFFVNGM